MIIGSHVSFGRDGLLGSVKEAISYGANTFMFYTGAPQNTLRKPIDMENTKEAWKLMKENNIDINTVICHAPYIVNLANNLDERKYNFSISFLTEEIKRCEEMGIKYIVLHPGSSVGIDRNTALDNIAFALNQILKNDHSVTILLETMAGKGTEIGCNLEEIKYLIDHIERKELIGVCIDTCHLNDAGYDMKKFDEFMDGRMPAGFEMLINNFSAGIIGMILAMLGYILIGPIMSGILAVLSAGVNILVQNSLLPLVAIFIEPAKVLFLNNAINHGIFTPLATAQAADMGKSIMYMLEPNPGAGLGVLLAYMFFCKDKVTKDSAPGAVIIHLLGGIHEIYFPYILMNPLVIVAPILGNMASIFWFSITDCGLVGPASPGSIIAYLMMTPGSDLIKVIIGVLLATGISFAVASPIVKMAGGKSLEEAQNEVASMKSASKGETVVPGTIERSTEIRKIIFACDAGMGSSAMGATKFRNRIKNDRPDISVSNTSVDNIPQDCDIAVVQTTLAARAKKAAPNAQLITIGNFLADPALDALYVQLTTGDAPAAPAGENTDIVIPDTPIKKQ